MADQTNAEVSDERLREIAEQSPEGRILRPKDAERSEVLAIATELLNRRSVTSQASEGEVAGWFWRWASSDEWRPLSRSGTEAGRADFVRDQEKIAPVVVAQLYLAPVSKRVERLETLVECAKLCDDLAKDHDMAGNSDAYSAGMHDAAIRLFVAIKALQGGRS